MNTLQRSYWSGSMATSAMTLGLMALWQLLPRHEKKELPPARLTESVLGTAPAGLTLLSHYGFGLAAGTAYTFLRSLGTRRIPGLLTGAGFGLGIWATSYLGWIPALGLKPSGYRMSGSRNAMMFAAHIIWEAALGFAEEQLHDNARRQLELK